MPELTGKQVYFAYLESLREKGVAGGLAPGFLPEEDEQTWIDLGFMQGVWELIAKKLNALT